MHLSPDTTELCIVRALDWLLFPIGFCIKLILRAGSVVLDGPADHMGCSWGSYRCIAGSTTRHVHVAGNETDWLAMLHSRLKYSLGGKIPVELEENSIGGDIPVDLGRLTNLEVFLLRMNRLVGTIPFSIFNLSSATEFNVVMNQIQGSLPRDLGITLPNLSVFEVGVNSFTRSIPVSMSNATKLQRLGLAGNKFTGKVPPLDNLHDLQLLNFHGNGLGAGEANDLRFLYSLTNVTNLNVLDLSKNNFGGLLHESIGNLSTNLGKLILSNNGIVGIIPTGIRNLINLQILDLSNNNFTGNILADIGKFQKLQNWDLSGLSFFKLSYQSLRKATDGFSLSNLVCVGSFGYVYKGVLGEGEKVVVVKVLNLQRLGACKSFFTECETLRHIKYRNLLKVLTACSSADYHGNDFKALNPIVHCDLKPSNVLLDNEMTAHVGDFGLARFIPGAIYDRSANQSSSVGIRGGVYWYGIHLLETFTAKRPTDNMFCDSLGLHNYVKIALPKQAASIIADLRLFKQKDQSFANTFKIKECLISILKVAVTMAGVKNKSTDGVLGRVISSECIYWIRCLDEVKGTRV
ncbi:hypothetical protein TEA_004112 [Camellia sinensis var. sinensis]|uniref:Protein kinase domain-containing protein n=1 Tax=Camellia sinensis var. sinensis TaxID=542762 RepID=A0A4S4EV85_CAMSN|nr:hypothetical protein TEA_004112 [Camellia sinensis var. sinensis]